MLNNLSGIFNKLPHYFGIDEALEGNHNILKSSKKLIDKSAQSAASLSDYLSYRYYDEESGLFFNDGPYIGFCLEIAPIVGVDEGMLKNLEFFFNNEMPENSYLQFLLVASHNVESILNKWESARQSDHPIIKKINKKRTELFRNLAVSFDNYDGRSAKDYRIYICFSQQLPHLPKYTEATKATKEKLILKLKTLNLQSRVCDAEDLIELVQDVAQMRPEVSKDRVEYDPVNLLSVQSLRSLEKCVNTADKIVHETTGLVSRSFYIEKLPKEFSLLKMINLLGSDNNNALTIPARLVLSYTIANDISKGKGLAVDEKGNQVIHAAEQWYSRNNITIKEEADEWREIHALSNKGDKYLTNSFNIMITAPKDKIGLATEALVSLYNLFDFKIKPIQNLQMVAMFSTLPMQQGIYWPALKYYKLVTMTKASRIAALLPIHAEWKGMPTSGVLFQGRRGQLFNWNLFYELNAENMNGWISGTSGGGKSFLLQDIVLSNYSQGVHSYILDIGRSFANLANLLDGEIIQFGRDSPLSLNPFVAFKPNMPKDDMNEFVACAKALLCIMCGVKADDALGAAMIEEAIKNALIAYNYDLDITKFAVFLAQSDIEELRKFGKTLYSYTEQGIYGKYFSGAKAARFNTKFTLFEFEEIKNDPRLVAIILQIILMEITNKYFLGDRSKNFMIIVDEAWMLLDYAAPFFGAFVRTVRKYGGSLVICVQNLADLIKTPEHMKILQNSAWSILLKKKPEGLDAYKNSDAFKDIMPLIQSLHVSPEKYSEVLLCATGVRVVGRLVVDNFSKAIYSTKKNDFNFIQTRLKEGVALEIAIEELAIRKYGSV